MSTINLGLQWMAATLSWEALEKSISENDVSDIQGLVDIQDCLTAHRIELHNLEFELTKRIQELDK